MPKNEDGEFELVLGNRQLFGVFFIVVMLFGVFFVMGYIVGQNSTPAARPEVASARKPETKPLVVDSPGRPPEPDVSTAPVETTPQTPPPVETSSSTKTPPKAVVKNVEPQKAPEPVKAAPPRVPLPSAKTLSQPGPGETYLQLAATAKTEADTLVDVLRKNGFKALDYEVPEKPNLYRVLVGPIADGELNKMKADLQGKGFQGNAAIKKTF